MKRTRRWVTPALRQGVISLFPKLNDYPAYWGLLRTLLFGTFVDEETRKVILSQEVLAKIEGVEVTKKYGGEKLLLAFQRDVLPEFMWSEYTFTGRKARTVENYGFPPELLNLREAFYHETVYDDVAWVDFESGIKRTKKVKAAEVEEVRGEIFALMYLAGNSDTRDIVDYQNALPSNLFQRLVECHKAEAHEHAEQILPEVNEDGTLSYAGRNYAKATINAIIENPKPLIKPTANSARAVPYRASLLTVQREIRNIFAKDWFYYDFVYVQLAIIARDWYVPLLLDFLDRGNSPWEYILHALQRPKSDKPYFKTAIYSLVYGGGIKNIKAALDHEVGEGMGANFFHLPLIKAVYEAREQRLQEIITQGRASTVYETFLPIEGKGFKEQRKQARSILAQQAQAVELMLIHPIYELARTTEAFRVALYVYDGVYIHYERGFSQKWHEEILAAVQFRARELDVPTRLQLEN
jgi:hypothetical protein